MDKMSLFSILTVSVPEATLNLLIGMIATGNKRMVVPNRDNIPKLIAAILLMVAATCTVRAVISSVVVVFSTNLILCTLIIMAVYRVPFWKSLSCCTIFFGIIIATEAFFTSIILVKLGINLSDIYADDVMRLLCFLPTRLIQVLALISLWGVNLVWSDLSQYKKGRTWIIVVLLSMYIIETIYLYGFVQQIKILDLGSKVVHSIGCIIFSVLNLAMFKFVSVVLKEQQNISQQSLQLHAVVKEISDIFKKEK